MSSTMVAGRCPGPRSGLLSQESEFCSPQLFRVTGIERRRLSNSSGQEGGRPPGPGQEGPFGLDSVIFSTCARFQSVTMFLSLFLLLFLFSYHIFLFLLSSYYFSKELLSPAPSSAVPLPHRHPSFSLDNYSSLPSSPLWLSLV